MNISEIAEVADAAIIVDRDGDIALLRRHYDNDGRREVRYAPDPCDHYPEDRWEAMTPEEAAARVC